MKPNFMNSPEFAVMVQAYISMNPNFSSPTSQAHSNYSTPPQPTQVHPSHGLVGGFSQYLDRPPTTPGDGSTNLEGTQDYFQTQNLDDDEGGGDDDDDEESSKKGKGKGKLTRERWSTEEDKTLVSIVVNCGGDVINGTDQTKARLWRSIVKEYEKEMAERPTIIHPRAPKSIKNRWKLINEGVTLWISQLGEAERKKASGQNIDDVEEEARKLYVQAHNKHHSFAFYECVASLREYSSRWDTGKDSTDLSIGGSGSKRSSDGVGHPRPEGVKKAKAQRKMKGVALQFEDFNTNLGNMGDKRDALNNHISELLAFQREKEERKEKFKVFQLLLKNKANLTPSQQKHLDELQSEFLG